MFKGCGQNGTLIKSTESVRVNTKKERKERKIHAHHHLKVQRQRSSTRSDRKHIQAPLAAAIWTMHDLGAQPQGGRKTGVPRQRWTNLRPHADPGSRSWVVEVGSVNDDHYANLTPLSTCSKRMGTKSTLVVDS